MRPGWRRPSCRKGKGQFAGPATAPAAPRWSRKLSCRCPIFPWNACCWFIASKCAIRPKPCCAKCGACWLRKASSSSSCPTGGACGRARIVRRLATAVHTAVARLKNCLRAPCLRRRRAPPGSSLRRCGGVGRGARRRCGSGSAACSGQRSPGCWWWRPPRKSTRCRPTWRRSPRP